MPGTASTLTYVASHRQRRSIEDPRWLRWLLIGIAIAFVGVFLVVPLLAVFAEALSQGVRAYTAAFADQDTQSAIRLTLLAAGIAVPARK